MEVNNHKVYSLKSRTIIFAKAVRNYVDRLPNRITNSVIGNQLMRSAGSVGANYLEADEALSKKDLIFRMKICRKEAKESCFWLELSSPFKIHEADQMKLVAESKELVKIFSVIIYKINL